MNKLRFATAWLGGCSGCHMSFLDLDEKLIDLADLIELVYSPIADVKEFPENVDVTLVEGAVANLDNLKLAQEIRARSRLVVSFGDCAVTGNVPAMRNPFGVQETCDRAYFQLAQLNPMMPTENLPRLLKKVVPVHDVVPVDLHIPGCPPPADTIFYALTDLVRGRVPDIKLMTRFGK